MPEKKKLALRLEGVSIDFRVRMQHSRSLREIISGKGESKSSVVNAVRNVSFDVNEGESVGIIGLNGSGKSTLLSGIAGVLPISEGQILVSDEPRLMGVNAVLMSESSGLKNIELGLLNIKGLDNLDQKYFNYDIDLINEVFLQKNPILLTNKYIKTYGLGKFKDEKCSIVMCPLGLDFPTGIMFIKYNSMMIEKNHQFDLLSSLAQTVSFAFNQFIQGQ